jgi:hypothetical protein
MRIALIILIVLVALVAVAWAVANRGYRARMAEAEAAWAAIAAAATPEPARFDPASLAGLPEVAQRYFRHAIAPGTPLATTVELTMAGTFRLGEAANPRTFAMTARQILAPPDAFVWIARMTSGPMVIRGADMLHRGQASMRFWLWRAIPLADAGPSPDLNRSAAARPALEAIWAPASLLPAAGAAWVQAGPDSATVTLPGGTAIELTLDAAGALRSVVGQRWSDANPDRTWRLQPFGGTMRDEATFGGFTIPSVVSIGNNFGTDAFFAFFDARVTAARFR